MTTTTTEEKFLNARIGHPVAVFLISGLRLTGIVYAFARSSGKQSAKSFWMRLIERAMPSSPVRSDRVMPAIVDSALEFRTISRINCAGYLYGPMHAIPSDAAKLPEGLLPPDLIIQDELHLISGPLGTMVGLYEAAIDYLCERVVDGVSRVPKVVCSTATVRRAREQILALFGRRMELFPPRGISHPFSPNRRGLPAQMEST